MVLEFSVENFRSFRTKQTFSMLADSAKNEYPENVIDQGKGLSVLSSAMVYGANASGKSNLMKAFQAMRDLVLYSGKNTPEENFTAYSPFKFNSETHTEATQFELVFIAKQIRYRYAISILGERVVSEKLLFYPQGREAKLFGRVGQKFEFGDYLKGQKAVVAEITAPNQLFLSKAAQNNLQQLTEVFLFFELSFMAIPFLDKWIDSKYLNLIANELEKDNSNKLFINSFKSLLKSFDTGIFDFKIKKNKEISGSSYEVYAEHLLFNKAGEKVGKILHPIAEESEGTQKLFVLGGLIIRALQNGRTILIDEFERSLHPHISRYLLQLFNNPEINTHQAQLIIATHDSNLLMHENHLRRDQVWLIEKDLQGASKLFSLADFGDIRFESPYEKWYLNGKFGGVPRIESLDFELNLQDEAA